MYHLVGYHDIIDAQSYIFFKLVNECILVGCSDILYWQFLVYMRQRCLLYNIFKYNTRQKFVVIYFGIGLIISKKSNHSINTINAFLNIIELVEIVLGNGKKKILEVQ